MPHKIVFIKGMRKMTNVQKKVFDENIPKTIFSCKQMKSI